MAKAATPTTCVSETFQGIATQRLVTAWGDELRVARQGAHALSWIARGQERLFLSPQSIFDGQTAIRGGIPICFPQFNQRGTLPKHGFARNIEWQLKGIQTDATQAQMVWGLGSSEITRQWWPANFDVRCVFSLTPDLLRVTLQLHNTDSKPLEFTGALHTYLAVQDIAQTSLNGLAGRAEWDAVADTHASAAATLRFDAEFDRVYDAPANVMILHDGASTLEITQSESWAQSVVWNPGSAKCAALADMPALGYQHMLCVEAAQVFQPVSVAAGAQWTGWQQLRALDGAMSA